MGGRIKMIIDTENLDTLNIHELGMLIMLYDKELDKSKTLLEVKDLDLIRLLGNLEKKGYVISSVYEPGKTSWSLVEKGKQALIQNCVKDRPIIETLSKRAVKTRSRLLAPKLMDVYPTGNKPGTFQRWRGSSMEVSEELYNLLMAGIEFTDEEAVNATKAYINSFNGMTTTMRTLPNFLNKRELIGGEVKRKSDFLSFLEDMREGGTTLKKDWETRLC